MSFILTDSYMHTIYFGHFHPPWPALNASFTLFEVSVFIIYFAHIPPVTCPYIPFPLPFVMSTKCLIPTYLGKHN